MPEYPLRIQDMCVAILKDVVDTYLKKGKLDQADQEKLIKKHTGTFQKLDKESSEALQVLMSVMHANLTDNATKK